MVDREQDNDFIQTLNYPLFLVEVESEVNHKHHIGLIDVHKKHEL